MDANKFAADLFDFACDLNRAMARQIQAPQPPHELEKIDSREVYSDEDQVP